jgi:hypothetical protein
VTILLFKARGEHRWLGEIIKILILFKLNFNLYFFGAKVAKFSTFNYLKEKQFIGNCSRYIYNADRKFSAPELLYSISNMLNNTSKGTDKLHIF